MDKLQGSIETLSAMQTTADTDGKDDPSKTILRHTEVLAVILKGAVREYKGYSLTEVQGFIVPDSITNTTEVSPGRTNTEIRGGNPEFNYLNEKTTHFDLAFQAKNPQLSTEDIQINLHIDLEPQKTYKPGYPIEKRGLYYLARRLSSQLSLVLEGTDYNLLSKCYSIFICRDDIPQKDCYSLSVYEMTNTKNTASDTVARENYDLMTLVVIKLGNEVYNGDMEDEGYDLFRFLNAIMYPHKEDFMSTVTDYIDYSGNAELWREVTQMSSLEQVVYAGVRDDALKSVRKEMMEAQAQIIATQEELTAAKEALKITKEKADAANAEVNAANKRVNAANKRVNAANAEAKAANKRANAANERANAADERAAAANERANAADERAAAAEEQGIQAVILDNLDGQVPKEKILMKLKKHFGLTDEKSTLYYEKYAGRI